MLTTIQRTSIVLLLAGLFLASPALAHFGMIIPSDEIISQGENRTVSLQLSFSHPFEKTGMQMAKPKAFGVMYNGKKLDLATKLKPIKVMGHSAWKTDYKFRRPGVYSFYTEPVPYWEPAEDCYIVHYTKTIVAAFGSEEGWDQPVGLKTEIVPLTRPFGLYAGNVFRGQVLLNGKPAAGCDVEVEFYNKSGKIKAPNDYMVTQVVKTDSNGIFSFAPPAAGWWGFAGLNTSDKPKNYQGKPKDVELGAVLWVKFIPWPGK